MSSHSRHAQAFVSIPVSGSKSARKLVSPAYSKFLRSDRHKWPTTNSSFDLFYCSLAFWKQFYFVFWKTCYFLIITYFCFVLFLSWAVFCVLGLCTGRTAHRGNRGIALLFLDHGTRRGWEVSVTPRPLFTPGKYLVPILQEAGWAPGLVWTGAENLAPTRIRFPDHPTHSQSLYRLRYPSHIFCVGIVKYIPLWEVVILVCFMILIEMLAWRKKIR